jgi:hypothetical protein
MIDNNLEMGLNGLKAVCVFDSGVVKAGRPDHLEGLLRGTEQDSTGPMPS